MATTTSYGSLLLKALRFVPLDWIYDDSLHGTYTTGLREISKSQNHKKNSLPDSKPFSLPLEDK